MYNVHVQMSGQHTRIQTSVELNLPTHSAAAVSSRESSSQSGAQFGDLGLSAAMLAALAKAVPNGNGRVHLIPGLGHVPHLEAPDKVLPPLIAFLKESLTAR